MLSVLSDPNCLLLSTSNDHKRHLFHEREEARNKGRTLHAVLSLLLSCSSPYIEMIDDSSQTRSIGRDEGDEKISLSMDK
jgi:hypothetical protein